MTSPGKGDESDPLHILRELMNSLGIVGPNIRHATWQPDTHMPEPWPGPGWCVCSRILPCEAQEVGVQLLLADIALRTLNRSNRPSPAPPTSPVSKA